MKTTCPVTLILVTEMSTDLEITPFVITEFDATITSIYSTFTLDGNRKLSSFVAKVCRVFLFPREKKQYNTICQLYFLTQMLYLLLQSG